MYTGNPNLHENRPWPLYEAESEVYLLENVPRLSTLTNAQFSAEHNCAFWDGVLIYQSTSASVRAARSRLRRLTLPRPIAPYPSEENQIPSSGRFKSSTGI